ncbi:MAG: nicotinate-nucleotide adenylyltransferase [Vicinamibacterales bacterium]
MRREGRVGVIGGTFDPIHCGHVAVAREAQRALGLDHVTLIPSRQPPHRPDVPRASGHHRRAMAALAAIDHPTWRVSTTELERPGPSYAFDTLTEVAREGHEPSQIFFLLGTDAFAEIATWSRYPAVLDLAHFAVISRPGTPLSSLRQRLPDLASRMIAPGDLAAAATPRVILLELTTPDVSSTDIRARVQSGRPIEGLVPDTVASYIDAQHLYRIASSDPSTVAGR